MSPTQEVHETTDRPHRRKIGLLDQVEYRLAETKAEKEAIYALRYRAYLHEGAIEPRADQQQRQNKGAVFQWPAGLCR